MNTRQPIQPSNTPAVLDLSFSSTRTRFIAALSTGLRVFRSDNCRTTFHPTLPTEGGLAIAEALDDRYLAFVAGGRLSSGSASVVIFWDCVLEREVSRFDFYEAVLGIRMCERWMVVVLKGRTAMFEYQDLARQLASPPPERTDDSEDEDETKTEVYESSRGPNRVKTIHNTVTNPYALACLRNDLLVLPAQTPGQVQLVPLPAGSKRILRAHNTALRCMALSPSGSLLATASEQGTLIRVYDPKTLAQIAEFRRGMERAVVQGLAFSDGGTWLACTSDKGTVHIFDLRPARDSAPASPTAQSSTSKPQTPRKTVYHPHSTGAAETASLSARSTSTHGSIQEYYGLRPPPPSASHQSHVAAASAMAAFKGSSFAPKFLKDVRSVASAPFYTGTDSPHWQGGKSFSWTVAPDGTKKRVRNVVPSLPSEPSGRPPKGIVAFAPAKGASDDDGVVVYVVGGGSDARWEMFELLPAEGGGNVLVNRGFRRYLTRQFVD